MAWLLDTSALLAHFRGEPGAERVQACFEDEEQEVFLASVSLAEFARRLRDLGLSPEDALAVVSRYTAAATRVVAIDSTVATQAFHLICAAPKRIPLIDALIAAAAAHARATLLHRDSHLDGIPGSMLAQERLSSLA
jgi:predicted nucleic acid-binding protein